MENKAIFWKAYSSDNQGETIRGEPSETSTLPVTKWIHISRRNLEWAGVKQKTSKPEETFIILPLRKGTVWNIEGGAQRRT